MRAGIETHARMSRCGTVDRWRLAEMQRLGVVPLGSSVPPKMPPDDCQGLSGAARAGDPVKLEPLHFRCSQRPLDRHNSDAF